MRMLSAYRDPMQHPLVRSDPPSRNRQPAPFVAVTARVLTLNFDPAHGLHDYYPLVFEVGNVSLLTMTIHASLVTICIPSGESMRNASMGHLVGHLCICDGQSSCCYSTTIDKAVQQELNALLTSTASHLRKILEEHKRPTPTGGKSKIKDTDIGNDPGSERARLRVGRFSTLDRPEAVRFPDEEAKKLSTILVVLWEQYVEAVAGRQDLRFVLYEPLQRARVARLAEAYLVLDKDLGSVYYDAVVGEDMYRRMVRKIRSSNYFKSFPVLEIECWPLDGNHKNTPIIFEERYRPFSATTINVEGKFHHQPGYAHCRAKASPILLQLPQSRANCYHVVPANFLISSAHLTFCRPLLRFPSLGIQSLTLNDHRLSSLDKGYEKGSA
ncbi:protein FAM135B-like [Dermacentor andersoni]|uniref:protein FAM135B-like n=1 Tax=Dermacentor andersoni TaxID=34620 RepID=UPI002416BEFE|nr:protein FAM135A-like [Dermacentor andersoni]